VLEETTGHRVVEHSLEQAANLAGCGIEALLPLPPDNGADIFGGDLPDLLGADIRHDVLFEVATGHRVVPPVPLLDVPEESLRKVRDRRVLWTGDLGKLFLPRWRLPQRHGLCRFIALQARVLERERRVLAQR